MNRSRKTRDSARAFLRLVTVVVLAAGTLVGTGRPLPASADSIGPQFAWTATGISPRAGAGMAFDEATGTTVLFGGSGIGHLNDTWTSDGSTWTPQAPSHAPSPRVGVTMAYDAADQQVVLFGGANNICPDAGCTDTWTWDGSDWTKQSPAHSPPFGGYGGTQTAMAYDAATDIIVLFDGSGNGTWTWDGIDWHQESPAHSPTFSQGATMAYDAATGTIVLFGGDDGSTNCDGLACGETWTWNGSDWHQETPTHSPSTRPGASMAYDGSTGNVVLFGGCPCGDTWTWDGSDWHQETPADSPPDRARAMMDYDSISRQVVLFGGSQTNDWWTWDGSDWTEQSPGTSPYGSNGMAYDVARRNVVLFVGVETWTWDGAVWSQQHPLDSPSPRDAPALAYDSAAQQVVLFGGDCPSGFPQCNDTWTWDGSDWTERFPADSPPAREEAFMADDPATGNAVLFGGDGDCGACTDTWTWNGSEWHQEFPAHSPPSTLDGDLTYDDANATVVLLSYRGDCGGEPCYETWTWDGSDWSKQHPATSPPVGPNTTPMAYDPATGTIVLFDGACSGDTTWSWDGSDWTQLFPANNPPPRTGGDMTFDSNGNALLFGGAACDPGPDSASFVYGPKPTVVRIVGEHGGTVATSNALSSSHPLATSVRVGRTKAGGMVSITQTRSTETAPPGLMFLNAQAMIAAPRASPASPLKLVFRLAPSLVVVDPGARVHVFRREGLKRNPVEVARCTTEGVLSPNPCVSSEATAPGETVKITVLTSSASTWNFAFPGKSLTVSKRGTGDGTVTSQPRGISCGSVCRAGFLPGTKVTLTASPRAGSVFTRWSGDCSGTGTCTLTMKTAHAAAATFVHKPDAEIKLASGSKYLGADVYNTTARDQTKAVKAKRGTTETFDIAVQNPGTGPDTYRLKGLGNTTNFTVRYLAGKSGTTDITAAVEAGTYTLSNIARGGTRYIRMRITVKGTASVGSTFGRLVTATSTHASTAKDAVKGVVNVASG
jgi:hypothetical protein